MSSLARWSLLASLLFSAPAMAQEAPALPWGDAERQAYVFQAAQRGEVLDVAFGADGAYVAVATHTGHVSLVDAHAGVVLATRRLASTSALDLRALQLDARGRWVLLSASTESEGLVARRWDLLTGAMSDVPTGGHETAIEAYSPDGTRFLGIQEELVVGRVANGRVTARASLAGEGALSWPDARGIVGYDPRAHVLEVLDPARLTVRATLPGTHAIAIDAPRHRVLARTADAIVGIDLRTGRETLRIARPFTPSSSSPALVASSDGSRVAVIDAAGASIVVALDGSAADRPLEGTVLWLSRTHAILRALDRTVGRHLIATGARSSWVSSAPLSRGQRVFIGPDGPAIFQRSIAEGMAHLEISLSDGTRHTLSMAGEHDVWWAASNEAHVALGGRFGLDVWTSTGVRAMSSCARMLRHQFDAGRLLTTDGSECDLATGRAHTIPVAGPAVSDSGLVTGIAGGPVQLPAARRDCGQEGERAGCAVDLTVQAGGLYVVMSQVEESDEDVWTDHRVYEVASRRVVASFPRSAHIAVDPQGRWAAAISAQHVSLVALPSGVELAHLGAPVAAGQQARSAPFAISGDGTRLAVSDGRAVRVLEATSGRVVATIAAPGVEEIVLSPDGGAIALRTGRSMRSGRVDASLAVRDVEGALSGVFCASGRASTLDPAGPDLPLRDLGSCLGVAELDGGSLVARSEGAVRVRRAGGAELTFRSLRRVRDGDDGEPRTVGPVIHFAHDDAGHYWSDAEGELPIRIRGADGALAPMDPALADPSLLTRFFAAP